MSTATLIGHAIYRDSVRHRDSRPQSVRGPQSRVFAGRPAATAVACSMSTISTRFGSAWPRRRRFAVLVVRRGDQAGDDQLPNAEAGARRSFLRAHLRSDQGLGVLLRQVQAYPPCRHRLRQVRRRSDARQGPPRADGPHRAGRAGRAHLVREGHAEPPRPAARYLAAQPGAGALLRVLPRDRGRRGSADDGDPGDPGAARRAGRGARGDGAGVELDELRGDRLRGHRLSPRRRDAVDH